MHDSVDSDASHEFVHRTRVASTSAALVVNVRGEIDLRNAADFGRALTGAVEECTTRRLHRLVVDLSGVGFMSSGGLQQLLRALARCSRAGVELVLARPSRPAGRVLDLSGMRHLVVITDQPPPD